MDDPVDGGSAWGRQVGKDTIAQIWRARELRPSQVEVFKLSNDPDFEAKLVDIVGLYNNPPDRAAVFCFDRLPRSAELVAQFSKRPGGASTPRGRTSGRNPNARTAS